MKICCIGDIHGTNKFTNCYNNILNNDNDCEKIIVFGDHFDPYDNITAQTCLEKYDEFNEIRKQDNRIVSLLGNHDLSYYIISNDKTNRTSRWSCRDFRNAILKNLDESYLCYKIGDYLFSHAGVSADWINGLDDIYKERILNNYTGWSESELEKIVSFFPYDRSCYGDDTHQGCTWIRPTALYTNPYEDYNQVVAHTRVNEITTIKMTNDKDLYLIDTSGKPDYLTLEI